MTLWHFKPHLSLHGKWKCKKKFPKVFRDDMQGNVNGILPTGEEVMAELSKWVVFEPTTDLL